MQQLELTRPDLKEIDLIRLKRELVFHDNAIRHTILDANAPGFILTEKWINRLPDITEIKRSEIKRRFIMAHERESVLALIGGYICELNRRDFNIIDPEKEFPQEMNFTLSTY